MALLVLYPDDNAVPDAAESVISAFAECVVSAPTRYGFIAISPFSTGVAFADIWLIPPACFTLSAR